MAKACSVYGRMLTAMCTRQEMLHLSKMRKMETGLSENDNNVDKEAED